MSMERGIDFAKRLQIVAMLLAGDDLHTIARTSGVAFSTLKRFVIEANAACLLFHRDKVRKLETGRLDIKVIWSFSEPTPKSHAEANSDHGMIWAWVAVDTRTRFVPLWVLGQRNAPVAKAFVSVLRSIVSSELFLKREGDTLSLDDVADDASSMESENKVLFDIFGSLFGSAQISDGDRLIKPFALHFLAHNFATVDQTTRLTPAMALGIVDEPWVAVDIVKVIDDRRLARRFSR